MSPIICRNGSSARSVLVSGSSWGAVGPNSKALTVSVHGVGGRGGSKRWAAVSAP